MHDASIIRRGPAWRGLDPYAQLIMALLPRATSICLFDEDAELRWSSETTTGPDLVTLVEDALATARAESDSAGQLRMLDGSTPVYLCWVRGESEQLVSIVAIVCREGREPQSFTLVHALLRPLLECLRRELIAQTDIRRLSSTLSARDQELDLLLSVAGQPTGARERGEDELGALLKSAGEKLRCCLAALVVPEKGLVLMRTTGERPPDSAALARTQRQLLALAQARRAPFAINRVAAAAGQPALPYRILGCPLRHPSGRTMGVFTLFRVQEAPEFAERDTPLAELLARRAVQLIESSYDDLSGLLTRSAFEQRVLAGSEQRVAGTRCSLLYADVDQLHVVNENFGMHVGDNIIAQLGELVRRRLPPGALAARISGDRIALLLPAAPGDAADFAESLREAAQRIGAFFGDARLHVSVSIGVAELGPRDDFHHVFAAAESACKAAKDRGRNRVEVFADADASIIRRVDDIAISVDVRAAIAEQRLRLDGQLILPLGTALDARPHFELLLRMIGHDGETLGPDRFLSAANRYQLMPEIDRWVVRHAIDMLRPHAVLLRARPVVFAINFSGQSIGNEAFEQYIVAELEASGLDPAIFCFELTESAAVSNITRAEVFMRRLRQLGCGVALDDFGTGLSSLSYLRQLPVDMLKIDGSFIRDILRDQRCESMVRAIAQLARGMGLVTVAEYVETEEILARVATLGVDYGQGFAIGRPTPLTELLEGLPVFAGAGTAVHRAAEPSAEDEAGLLVAIGAGR